MSRIVHMFDDGRARLVAFDREPPSPPEMARGERWDGPDVVAHRYPHRFKIEIEVDADGDALALHEELRRLLKAHERSRFGVR